MSSAPTAVESPPVDVSKAAVPRKRRRRAPATGATEDCFTCRKRKTKCDRRRPYCTQCIDMGKDCSGYRTTLTWGVGVASRGKLRGMSLPIAKGSPPPRSAGRDSKSPATSSKKSVTSNPSRLGVPGGSPCLSGAQSPASIASPSMHSPGYDFVNMSGSEPIAIPSVSSPSLGWHVPGFHEHLEGYHALSGKANRLSYLHQRPLQRLQTGLASSYDDTFSVSTGTPSTYSDSDYGSPSEYPQTPDEMPMMGPLFPPYNDQYLAPHTPLSATESVSYAEAPRSYPYVGEELGTSLASDHSGNHSVHSGVHSGAVDPNYPDIFYHDDLGSSPLYGQGVGYNNFRQRVTNPTNGEGVKQEENVLGQPLPSTLGSSVPHTPYPAQSFKMSPRMQFLLDYYDKSICPFLVAFDGPSNPYRMHIMHLAASSEGLQNAIAALATNNMRMRGQKEIAQLAYDNSGYRYSQMTPQEFSQLRGEPSAEELQYKARSIELLNAQLADPERAKDDSVLATLLILCLFHVSDSGFTKFTTQLAGVQKLLSMRDSAVQSGFIGLIELFFTWFDVMTSTVNDRESQFRADSLDIVNITANLGALEHLVGCDGRLFKLIARLGRLNLLSQNRAVRSANDKTSGHASQLSLSSMKGSKDYYSLQFTRLDGNGWGSPVVDGASHDNLGDNGEARYEFWAEWRDIRQKLQEWELNPSSAAAVGTSPNQRDLLHISESFRYSALLYTERLAHSSLPSSAANFQQFVSKALFHMSQIGVRSCVNKFLLWPLFVTGSECVDDRHRAIVRQRCIEIQRESGFYNNITGLEVLERIWREDPEGSQESVNVNGSSMGGRAFRWRKAMDRGDGDYLII